MSQPAYNMQLLISLVWATFTLYASALGDSLIYFPTEEASGSSPRESSISPNTARLLLASRLGLSQYHELGDVDERTLDTLSQFTSGKIFAQSEPQRKLLLIIDGAEAQKGKRKPQQTFKQHADGRARSPRVVPTRFHERFDHGYPIRPYNEQAHQRPASPLRPP